MQQMVDIGQLDRSVLGVGNELILKTLHRYCDQGLKKVFPAWGSAAPPEAATVSNSTRLILSIDGRNKMEIPQAAEIIAPTLRRGDLCFIDQQAWNNPLHTYAKCFLCIDFKLDRIRYYLRKTTGPGSKPGTACISWVNRAPDACTRHLVAACEHLLPQQNQADLLHQLSGSLIQQCIRELENPDTQSSEGQTWLRVCDWIDDHLHDNIDRGAVAVACHLHPNHISRLFRKHAGQRFIDYITEQRIARAKRLLSSGNLRMIEVAMRCGFSSAEYFCTVFKKQIGCTPKNWK